MCASLYIFPCLSVVSSAQPASVDHEHVAVDVVTGTGGKKDSGAGERFVFAPAACWNSFEDLAVACFVGLQGGGIGSSHVTRSDRVDVDIVFGPLVRECFRELGHTAFRSCVCRDGDAALKRQQRSDVDDLAAVRSEERRVGKEC